MRPPSSSTTPTRTPLSHTSQSYLDALRRSTITQNNSSSTTEPTTHTNISSLSTSVNQIKLANIQEHVTRSISLLQKEFKQFQQSLNVEIKNQIATALTNIQDPESPSYHNYRAKTTSFQQEFQSSLSSVKKDIANFRHTVKHELERSDRQPRH